MQNFNHEFHRSIIVVVKDYLEMAGLGPRAPHYTPHLTLLYGDRFVADHPVEPVGWTVHEFVLVHSLLGRSRYLLVARFPLGAQA